VTILQALPEKERSRAQALAKPLGSDKQQNLFAVMKIKAILNAHLNEADAIAAYRELMRTDSAVGLRRVAILGLLQAVQDSGEVLHVFHEGGVPYTCRAPRIDGPGAVPDLHGTPRIVFAGVLPNATVQGRSAAIRHGAGLVFDAQPGELDSMPMELAFDPMVFRRDGDEVIALEDNHPEREWRFDRAWSLMGINAVSFGHWMAEQLPRFLAASELPAFAGIPILIDQPMPPQHRQSLKLFGRNRFPLVEVPPGIRVRVERLHVMANWFYTPHLLTGDQGLDVSRIVPPVDKMAAVLAKAAASFDRLRPPTPSRGVFWARPTNRHRSISNADEVTPLLATHGFDHHLPEKYTFAEQIALLRGTDRVVVQNGSAMHALFLARPGTRLLFLSHPSLPFFSLFNEWMLQLGHEMTVLTGPFVRRAAPYQDQSDYELPIDRLQAVLKGDALALRTG
jgi:capsular polysaccharide biosynthesis protein